MDHSFRIPALIDLKQELLVARQPSLKLFDLAVHLVAFAQVSLEPVIERQVEISCRCVVELADAVFGEHPS